jgi:hypothetical protein
MTPECQRCGACCHGLDVLLTGAEADYFESDSRRLALTVLYPRVGATALRFMRRHPDADRCVTLLGTLGNCRCGIYTHRPLLCREFQAGSEDCQTARRRLGLSAEEPLQRGP